MKAFQFRLDPLLRLRRHRFDSHRRELEAARRRAFEIADEVRRVRNQAQSAQRSLSERASLGVSAPTFGMVQQGTMALFGRVRGLEREAREASARVAAVRKRVIDAQREMRVVETLRERAHEAHRKENARVEQLQLDELAARHRGRSTRPLSAARAVESSR